MTTGARIRAQSGVPRNTLGRHASCGRLESFLQPRGEDGRTAMAADADVTAA